VNTTTAANITVSGGNVADVATLAASGFASGMTTTIGNGVTLDGVTLNSNGGNIAIRGKSAISSTTYATSDAGNVSNANGIRAHGSVSVDAGAGKLSMWGYAQSSSGSSNGIEFSSSASVYKSASSASDAITIQGTAANNAAADAWGIYFWNSSSVLASNGSIR
jgi:hypothetical protein